MVEAILNFFRRNPDRTNGKAPKGYCPNCWGKQEYDGTIRELMRDHQIDVNNKQAAHTFIQKFVVEKIDGIKLKKGNTGLECPVCTKN